MGDIMGTFDQVIADLKKQDDLIGIYLVGSSVKRYPEFRLDRDIDLMIVTEKGEVSREVKKIDAMEYDFIFFNREYLELLLAEYNDAYLALLSSAIMIYANQEGEELLKKAKSIYTIGRPMLEENQINYIRFDLSHKLVDLERRLEDEYNFHYLANIYIEQLLKSYYLLHALWMPRRKKLMKNLFKYDMVLYELLKSSFTGDANERYKVVKKICQYVLEPYGGELYQLDRMSIFFD